jgi:hypothetical protein
MAEWIADAAAAVGLLVFIGATFVLASAVPAIIGAL